MVRPLGYDLFIKHVEKAFETFRLNLSKSPRRPPEKTKTNKSIVFTCLKHRIVCLAWRATPNIHQRPRSSKQAAPFRRQSTTPNRVRRRPKLESFRQKFTRTAIKKPSTYMRSRRAISRRSRTWIWQRSVEKVKKFPHFSSSAFFFCSDRLPVSL